MSIPNNVPGSASINGGSSTVPMCLAGILLGAVVDMSHYDIAMMKQQIDYKMDSAKAYAGVNNTDVNGVEGWNLDPNAGIVGRFISESVNAATSAGDAIEDEAIGQFAAAGVNLAGTFGTLGVGSCGGGDNEVTTQLDNAKALQTKMGNVQEGKLPDLELGQGVAGDSETLEEKQNQLNMLERNRGDEITEYLANNRELSEEKSVLTKERLGRENVIEDVQKNPRQGDQGKEDDESQISFMRNRIKEIDTRMGEIGKEQDELLQEKQVFDDQISSKKQEIQNKLALKERDRIEAHIRALTADEPDLSVFGKDSDLDDKALAHLKGVNSKKFEALQAKVNVRVEKLSVSDRETKSSRRSQRANMVGQLAGMGANAAQAGGHTGQAKEQVESSKEKAYADAEMTTQQTWSGQLSDTQQRADSFLQDANAIVAALAAPMRG